MNRMTKSILKIASGDFPNLVLREITVSDMENLRCWKNNNRKSFFYQEEILPEQQEKWFKGYLDRPYDYMFIVEENVETASEPPEHAIGCMGFRVEEGQMIDIYNVIRGEVSRTQVTMRDAMHMMLRYAADTFTESRIKCDVLKDNSAVEWYKKCGLAIWEEREYYIMGICKENIPEMLITVVSEERS